MYVWKKNNDIMMMAKNVFMMMIWYCYYCSLHWFLLNVVMSPQLQFIFILLNIMLYVGITAIHLVWYWWWIVFCCDVLLLLLCIIVVHLAMVPTMVAHLCDVILLLLCTWQWSQQWLHVFVIHCLWMVFFFFLGLCLLGVVHRHLVCVVFVFLVTALVCVA